MELRENLDISKYRGKNVETSGLFSITGQPLIGWRRGLLSAIGLNELRIRVSDNTQKTAPLVKKHSLDNLLYVSKLYCTFSILVCVLIITES